MIKKLEKYKPKKSHPWRKGFMKKRQASVLWKDGFVPIPIDKQTNLPGPLDTDKEI